MSVLIDDPGVVDLPDALRQRLGDPSVTAKLCQVLDKLDTLVLALDAMDGVLARSETILDSVVESAKDARATAAGAQDAAGIDLRAVTDAGSQLARSLPRLAPLIERLADPAVVPQLERLLDRLDMVVLGLSALDGLIARSETILDSAAEGARDARATVAGVPALAGVDLRAASEAGAQLLGALPRMAPALLRGVDSGAIDELTSPALVEVLHLVSGGAGVALHDPQPVRLSGPLTALRALKDPDTARGLSFFVTVARAVGRQLSGNANK